MNNTTRNDETIVKDKKLYMVPSLVTYDAQELIAQMGPAMAVGSARSISDEELLLGIDFTD